MGVTLPPSKIFPTSSTFSQHFVKAKDIQTNIASHKNLLNDHRKKYLVDQDQSMTEYERNYMEKVVTTNLRIIEDNVRTLEMDIKKTHDEVQTSKDAQECQLNILAQLKLEFQKINSTFKSMKEQRLKRQKEKDNLFKLHRQAVSKKKQISPNDDVIKSSHIHNDFSSNREEKLASLGSNGEDRIGTDDNTDGKQEGKTHSNITNGASDYLEEEMSGILGEISSEERQMLEEENRHLYQELMSNQEEVKQITRQVVELSQMQDLLTENVDIQAHQIEEIQDTIMAATENVRSGNEQVREAMSKDAGFRVWILFFLIVMSFTILFLDWYNS
ncbi:unnamed protein product [Meganyctiphanes norvegica]|uniref:t-SNARE coiled-coil homology domain-containing protein n=1 Tax=Meganyctiphanes norvegica TaxID=48144 RepID=A0AAV2QTK8_MEGNR